MTHSLFKILEDLYRVRKTDTGTRHWKYWQRRWTEGAIHSVPLLSPDLSPFTGRETTLFRDRFRKGTWYPKRIFFQKTLLMGKSEGLVLSPHDRTQKWYSWSSIRTSISCVLTTSPPQDSKVGDSLCKYNQL